MPPRWALLGGLLVATHTQFLYLARTYMGGSLGLAGGALLLGGLVRIWQRPRLLPAVAVGIALAVLANSRPSEGLILCCLLSIPMVVWLFRCSAENRWRFVTRFIPPVACILLLTAGGMAYYNWRITGDALTLPYLAHARQYSVAPNYIWEPLRAEPHYNHPIMRELHAGWEVGQYQRQVGLRNYLRIMGDKLEWLVTEVIWPGTWALALAAAVFAMRRDRLTRWSLVLVAVFVLLTTAIQVFINTHYLAPGAGLLVIATLGGLRWLRFWQRDGQRVGRLLVRTLVVMHLIALAAWFMYVRRASGWENDRAQIVRQLSREGGKHLIVVRYEADHDVHADWVANSANIDASPIVWAREMGGGQEKELLDYFNDRTVWLLDADELPHRLVPYADAPPPSTAPAVRPRAREKTSIH